MYREVITKNGRSLYFKGGKMISRIAYLAGIAERETVAQEVPDRPELVQEVQLKSCIFCGEPATSERFVNLQHVPLCSEHHETKRLGQIAEEINKKVETPHSQPI